MHMRLSGRTIDLLEIFKRTSRARKSSPLMQMATTHAPLSIITAAATMATAGRS